MPIYILLFFKEESKKRRIRYKKIGIKNKGVTKIESNNVKNTNITKNVGNQ